MALIYMPKRFKYYTGISVKPGLFNTDKVTRSRLLKIEKEIERLRNSAELRDKAYTEGEIRKALDKVLDKKIEVENKFFDQLEEVVRRMKAGIILTDRKKRYSALTIKGFNFVIGLLKQFEPRMSLHNISMDTYYEFITWCQSEKRDYSTNYIGSLIKQWKSLCSQVGQSVADSKDFKQISEEAIDVYLTEEEIAAIYNQAVTSREQVARDWFVLNCYAGLRVSDLTILDKKNLSKDYITVANEKTDTKVVIPVHPFVKSIITKYKGFPPKVSDVELNRTIKLVAKKAKIKRRVLHIITKGGTRRDNYLEKWQMISTHTSRRSFITNLLKNSVPESIVMKLTGIKASNTLKKYNKLTPDEAAEIAAGLGFFKRAQKVTFLIL